jgi:predicted ATPase with chaperone activity
MLILRKGYSRDHGAKTVATGNLLKSTVVLPTGVQVAAAMNPPECTVYGLLGASKNGKVTHRYFVTLSVPELAEIVREVMQRTSSPELFDAVVVGTSRARKKRAKK